MRQLVDSALKSSIPAVLVFVLVNAAAEKLCLKITGISIEHVFVNRFQTDFGILFQILNLLLFSSEIFLVMIFYGFIRMTINSKWKALFCTVLFFLTFTGLFLGQLINLKIYPLAAALVFSFTTVLSLPVSIFTGTLVYEKTGPLTKEVGSE